MNHAVINGPEAMKLQRFFIPFGSWHHLVVWLIAYKVVDEQQVRSWSLNKQLLNENLFGVYLNHLVLTKLAQEDRLNNAF